MDINLVRLRRFLSVYSNASFSRAAEELAMTHSALTKSVQQLEEELGVALLERTTRKVMPTEAGHRLAARAEELLAFAGQVRDEAVIGNRHLRLIAGPAVIEGALVPVLAAFHRSQPEVRITAESLPPTIAAARLMRREVDVLLYDAISLSALPDRRAFAIRPVLSEPYVAVMRRGHPASGRTGRLIDMLDHKWAISGFDQLYQAAIPSELEERFRQGGFPHYRVLSQGACLALLEQNDMIGLLPASVAQREAIARGLHIMPADTGAWQKVSAVTLRRMPPNPLLDELLGLFEAPAKA